MPSRDFDVLMATDFRGHGAVAASIAQEIEVQARLGLRTGIIQVDSDDVRRPLAERIQNLVGARLADLVSPHEPLGARLLVLRHPRIFGQGGWKLAARAEQVVMVADRPPEDGAHEILYDVPAVRDRLVAELGGAPAWAPVGPMVRESLLARGGPGLELTPFDWHDIIDVGAWAPRRDRSADRTSAIGRHARDDVKKWPENPVDLLSAYPDSPEQPVRILGGSGVARKLLGRTPQNWEVLAFGSVAPAEFLASLDVYVYFHHSGWREMSCRSILEALASGLPVVTHPYLERALGDACIYCEPHRAPAVVAELLRDGRDIPNRRGVDLVRARHDWEEHRRRLERYVQPPRRSIPRPPARRRRLLFVSGDEGGMGHLTRLLAIARRLPPDWEPLFLTQSARLEAVRKQGFWVDYMPPQPTSGLNIPAWHEYLKTRVTAALRVFRPEALVFDGSSPSKGILQAMEAAPQVRRIWSRRAMWKPIPPDRAQRAEQHVSFFDMVLEPGELAAEADRGITAAQRHLVRSVEPILLLEEAEILSREDARTELGIAPGSVAALLHLGTGNADRSDLALAIVEMLGRDPNVHLVAVPSLPANQALPDDGRRISRLETYPLTRVLRAFDFCIAAPAYNTFHELLSNAVPTVFIPNERTDVDDEMARAEWAARRGVSLTSREQDTEQLRRASIDILDPEIRESLRRRCRELAVGGGARQAADAIAALSESVPVRLARQPVKANLPKPAPHPLRRALWRLWKALRRVAGLPLRSAQPKVVERMRPKGGPLPGPGQGRVLVVAAGLPVHAVEDLADWVADRAGAVILAHYEVLPSLSRLGLMVELIADEDREWSDRLDFAAYSKEKSRALLSAYGCGVVVLWSDADADKRWPSPFLFGA